MPNILNVHIVTTSQVTTSRALQGNWYASCPELPGWGMNGDTEMTVPEIRIAIAKDLAEKELNGSITHIDKLTFTGELIDSVRINARARELLSTETRSAPETIRDDP